MTAYDFSLLHIDQADGVLWATIDAPPVNVMTVPLSKELGKLCRTVAPDDAVRDHPRLRTSAAFVDHLVAHSG